VSPITRQRLRNRKRRIQYRLRHRKWEPQDKPMFTASNIHYELADRVRAVGPGGIGAVHLLARRTGLGRSCAYTRYLRCSPTGCV